MPHRALLPAAAGTLALVVALSLIANSPAAAETGAGVGPLGGPSRPNFIVVQTDDQTLDGLYASYRPYEGAPAIRAMPRTRWT